MSKVIRICGVDPGVTTGYCLIEFLQKPLFYAIIAKGELNGPVRSVVLSLAAQPADFWAIEQWRLVTRRATEVSHNDPYQITPRIIGGLETVIPPERYTLQMPTTKKGVPDERLKELSLWDSSRHVRDALRHAVYFSHKFLEDTPKRRSMGDLLQQYLEQP